MSFPLDGFGVGFFIGSLDPSKDTCDTHVSYENHSSIRFTWISDVILMGETGVTYD